MKNYLKNFRIVITLSLFLICISIFANEPQKYKLKTINGNEYFGGIVMRTDTSVIFNDDILGVINFPTFYVKKIEKISADRIIDGKYFLDNPQEARYLWAPNGYGLKAGQGYYQNIWVMFNQVSLGFSDYFTLGVGVMPLFLFDGAPTTVWITPKFSIPVVKNVANIGAGALLGTAVGEDNTTLGLFYGIATLGSRDNNLSFGISSVYADGKFQEQPLFNFSGMVRVSPKFYLLTENYFLDITDNETFYSVGARYVYRNLSLDFALVSSGFLEGELFALPWLGVTIPFDVDKLK